jgi:transcriptional regulator with XRE-family HTH domain
MGQRQVKPDLAKLKKLRKDNKKTLMDLSKVLGYQSPNGYLYIENGRCRITFEQAGILANYYGVPVESLFYEEQLAKVANMTGVG